jgi:hypothetical protein
MPAGFSSYDAVGVKEDISDIITNISPTKTPFQTAIGNEKVHQKFFQWQEDSLRAAAANAQVEGFQVTGDLSTATMVPSVMRSNNTQILAEVPETTGTMDVTSTYGRARESAYQMAKSAAQVKRDLEVAFVGMGFNAPVNTNKTTARVLGSFEYQVGQPAGNNLYVTTQGVGSVADYTNLIFTGAANGGFAEINMLNALQNCYNQGAEPNTVSIIPGRAIQVAGFAMAQQAYAGGGTPTAPANYRQRLQDGQTTVVNAVTLYKSPFGDVKIILNRFQCGSPLAPSNGAGGSQHVHTLVYDPSQWAKVTLRPWFREVLAKNGDSLRQMIVGEFSLKHKNFRASSVIVENVAPTAGTTNMTTAAAW